MPIIYGELTRGTPEQLAESHDIKGSYLIAANLAALQAYTDTAVLQVGMLGCAADTGQVYQLATIGSPNTWNVFNSGSGNVYVWDSSIPFSTFYTNANIASLTEGIVVNLTGDEIAPHTMDVGAYTNMQFVAFQAIIFGEIDIAQGTTLDTIPRLIANVNLNSQSTTFVCTNPMGSITVGPGCQLTTDQSIADTKFTSLTLGGGHTMAFQCSLDNGVISGYNVFVLSTTNPVTLDVNMKNGSSIRPESFSGVSESILNLAYTADTFELPRKSAIYNFAGTINYLPQTDANLLGDTATLVWHSYENFSDFYVGHLESFAQKAVNVALQGATHTIDNMGSMYLYMNNINFMSFDTARVINIADGVTFDQMPSPSVQVMLNSQSSSFIVTDPVSAQPLYVGRRSGLSCDAGAKFISLTNTYFNIYLNGGSLQGSQVFDVTGTVLPTPTLAITSDNIAYIDPNAVYGNSHLVLHYADNAQISPPSFFTNFTGRIDYTPSSDADLLGNYVTLNWNGTYSFSDFYKMQNIANLTGTVIIELITGSAHIIDNMGAEYTNMNLLYFDSGMVNNYIIIEDGVTMDNMPNLWRNVTLITESSSVVCTNPAGSWYIGPNSAFTAAPTLEGDKFYGVLVDNEVFNITLDNGIFGTPVLGTPSELLRVQTSGTVNFSIANNQNIANVVQTNIYGSGSGVINLYSNGSYILQDSTTYTNFVGMINNNYFGLCPTSDEKDAMDSANFPNVSNPFATMNDIGGATGNSGQLIAQSNPEASNFFFKNVTTQGISTNNLIPLKTLDVVPYGGVEYDATIVVNSTTEPVIHAAFMLPTSMDDMAGFMAGEYAAKVWASVNFSLGVTTQLLFNGMNYHTYAGLTVTTTGIGTTRTATISPLSTVFVSGDANADPTLASILETPQGRYPIVGFTNYHVVTITVPSTYVNETSVAFSKYSIIAHWATPNIISNSLQAYTSFSSVRGEQSPAQSNWQWNLEYGEDKFAVFVWGITTSPSNVTITFAYGSSTACSKVETPKKFIVDSREEETDHDGNTLGYNTLTLPHLGAAPMNFSIPWEAKYILDAQIVCFANGATSTANIDLNTVYSNAINGAINQYSASDTSTLYKILGPDIENRISFLPLIPNAQRDTVGAVAAYMNDASPIIYVTKIKIYYYH